MDVTEADMPEKESALQFVTADVVDGDTATTGTFEFVTTAYPNVRSGVKLRDQKDERLKAIAENLATACKLRMNAMLAVFMCGQGSMGSFYLKSELPEGIHIYHDGYDASAIKKQVQTMEEDFGVKYDRVTINSVLLTVLTGETEKNKGKKALKAATGLKVDINDTYYNELVNGKTASFNYVPNDKIILSNSKNDNSDIFYFANLPTIEPETEGEYGVVGYIKDDVAWAVVRGIPVLKNKTAFSTITFK